MRDRPVLGRDRDRGGLVTNFPVLKWAGSLHLWIVNDGCIRWLASLLFIRKPPSHQLRAIVVPLCVDGMYSSISSHREHFRRVHTALVVYVV